MTHPTAKVVTLLLAAAGYRFAHLAPVPPPTKADKVTKGSLFERNVRTIALTTHAIPQILLLLQCIIILLHEMGQVQIAAMLCPASTSPSFNALSTMDVILAGVIVFMGLIRVWCFSTLGQFFTYEITIRPNHKLVTSGPYSFVRHPGYTCSISVIIGMIFFMVFSPNTSLQACGITEMVSLAKWVAWAWAAMVVYICWILVGRTSIEDENLRRTFGKEWEQYRNRVTKRFIPGLI